MPSQFFDNFPLVEYSNNVVRNIFAKIVLDDKSKQQPENFIQIRLEDDVALRADVIADRYYGSPYFDWIHYMSNDVIDPYSDVFLDSESFINMIVKKYGNIELAKQKIVFYINNWSDKPEDKLSIDQYENSSKNIKKYYTAQIDYTNRIIGYVRHRKDWTRITNKIRILQIDKTTSMAIGDLIAQFVSGQQVASAEVTDVNTIDKKITVKNITGEFVTTIGNTVYRFNDSTQYSVSSIISPHTEDNITTEESAYWSPVSYFDHENELNELKRNINLLRKEGVTLINKNLQKLLE